MDERSFTSKQTIQILAVEHEIKSIYGMAKFLSDENINVQIGQIKRWLNGASMSKRLAEKIHNEYNIVVTDARGSERRFMDECKHGIISMKSRGEL